MDLVKSAEQLSGYSIIFYTGRRIMSTIEQLKTEHKAIKLMLSILDKICQKLESNEIVNPKHLDQILEFLKTFADKCHHAKEEELLFPAMEKAGIQKEGGPLGVMLAEHKKAREHIQQIAEAVTQYKTGDSKAKTKIIENTKSYIRILSAHIDKEDNVLYPLANARIPEETMENLFLKSEEIETERIGLGKHEEFHRILENLKNEYLG
jgi:hemerythrin-like domain-containing protein